MTDQEINIAIAKALGIKVVSDGISHNLMPCDFGGAYNPDGVSLTFIPNYCQDLNETHLAWQSLTHTQKKQFEIELYRIIIGDGDYNRNDDAMNITNATARQRANAFIKTLNPETT